METLRGLWAILTSDSEAPSLGVSLIAVAIALILVAAPQLWRGTRYVVTIVHELGHALVGIATGHHVASFTFQADTSGETKLVGRGGIMGAPARILATGAGYPFPALVGTALLAAVAAGHAPLALGIMGLLAIFCLLMVRNLHGLGLLAMANLGLWSAAYLLPETILTAGVALLAWILTLGGLKVMGELARSHLRGEKSDSDIAVLTRWLPPLEWLVFLLYFTIYGAALIFMTTRI